MLVNVNKGSKSGKNLYKYLRSNLGWGSSVPYGFTRIMGKLLVIL
jgi:hypothetical protein|tara:strand:+ start:187 stop:321 length:135 start_codon:yes stop_codon:yes gene_type:complete